MKARSKALATLVACSLFACGAPDGGDGATRSTGADLVLSPRPAPAPAVVYPTFPAWGWLENAGQSCLAGAEGEGLPLEGTAPDWCDSTFRDLGELFQYNPSTSNILTWHGNCVDASNASTLIETSCAQPTGTPDLSWWLDQDGQFHTTLTPSRCLNAGRGYAGVPFCSDWATQQFNSPQNLNSNDTGYVPYTIAPYAPAQTGLVLGVIGGRTYNNTNGSGVQIETEGTDTISEQWWYDPSTKEIHLTDSQNMCLEVRGELTADGSYLGVWSCWGGQNQQWTYVPPNQWVSAQTGKCMDVPGESVAPGTGVWIWDCWGGLNQQWDGPHPAGGPQRGFD